MVTFLHTIFELHFFHMKTFTLLSQAAPPCSINNCSSLALGLHSSRALQIVVELHTLHLVFRETKNCCCVFSRLKSI
ncbi:hypothetical protein SLA2020_007170 [Shorea laevis]